MPPKISVLTSCYNASEFLTEAIESILCQTYKDFEFILIDDGSTDDTLAIIKSYATKDNRIVVIEKENTGLTDSLNVGIGVARGEWIARMDSDDFCALHRLESQLSFIKNNPGTVLIGSGFVEIDEFGKSIKAHRYPTNHRALVKNLERFKRFFPHSSAFFSRDAAVNFGGYNLLFRRSQDWDLWLRLSRQGKIACLNDSLVYVRKHTDQISHTADASQQMVFGYAASLCHFLRKFGTDDPSKSEDETKWKEFLKWVEKRIAEEAVFERNAEWSRLRQTYFTAENRFISTIMLVRGLLSSKHAANLLIEKLAGSSLSENLAREWMDKECVES